MFEYIRLHQTESDALSTRSPEANSDVPPLEKTDHCRATEDSVVKPSVGAAVPQRIEGDNQPMPLSARHASCRA